MKTYDLYKLAAQKILSTNYCVVSIKISSGKEQNVSEISEIGIVDKDENVVYEACFGTDENCKSFKDEFDNIVTLLSQYDHIVMFNEKLTKKLFNQTAEKYGLNLRAVEKLFKKAFCTQILYDAYVGFVNTKLNIACVAESIDTSNVKDAVSICFVSQRLIKTIASEFTHPNPELYVKAISNQKAKNENQQKSQKKKKQSQNHKKGVPETYAELFKDGKTLQEISNLKEVRVETVEGHIVSAFERGEIESIDCLIHEEYVEDVLRIIEQQEWDGKLRSIKEKLPEECTYISIKSIIAKNKKGLYAKNELSTTENRDVEDESTSREEKHSDNIKVE